MDNGEEIPGLNESWTFGGAKAAEWMAGFVCMIIFNEFMGTHAARAMPLLLVVMVGSTFILAGIRSRFPDEERGVRNLVMVTLGFAPPGIPTPSALQPVWSGCPVRDLEETSMYKQLDLGELFENEAEDTED